MRKLSFAVVVAASLVPLSRSAFAQSNQDLAQQVRAAQLVSDVVTFSVDEGDARLAQMQSFLQKNGKANDTTARQAPPQPRHLNYMEVFRGALLLVKDGKDPDADASLKTASDSELYENLTRTQFYNMHEFLHFNQQRDQFNEMMDYLKSAGLLDQFDKETGAAGQPPAPAETASTQQTSPNADSVAQRLEKLMADMKESAWQKAQADGMSRSQFDTQWPQQLADYRNSVEEKTEGFQTQAGSMGKAQAAGTPPPPDKANSPTATPTQSGPINAAVSSNVGGSGVAVAPTPNTATPPPSPSLIQPAVQSPYNNQTFQAKDYSLWDRFDYNNDYGRGRRR